LAWEEDQRHDGKSCPKFNLEVGRNLPMNGGAANGKYAEEAR